MGQCVYEWCNNNDSNDNVKGSGNKIYGFGSYGCMLCILLKGVQKVIKSCWISNFFIYFVFNCSFSIS